MYPYVSRCFSDLAEGGFRHVATGVERLAPVPGPASLWPTYPFPLPVLVGVSGIPSRGSYEAGIASWYGPGFHGRTTANGETYDMYAMTAAHKALPFDTWVRVVNLDNSESTVVRINDRGPFIEGRVIDLSRSAAEDISMVWPGTAQVQLLIVDEPIRRSSYVGTNSTPEVRTTGGSCHTEANSRRRWEALSGSGWCFSQPRQRHPAPSQTGG